MVFRNNIALYSNFSGDFEGAARVVNSIPQPGRPALLALAHSQVARGLLDEAKATYEKLATIDARGRSLSSSGLGDILIYQGRFAEAIRILEQGAAADLAAKNPDRAAIKFSTIGYAHILAGQKARAIEAAERALMYSKEVHTRFPAAQVFVEAGATDRAQALVAELSSSGDVWGGTPAHAKIIEGEIALQKGNPEHAIRVLTEANGILDTWLGHFVLGRAYLATRSFVQADAEFDRCVTRRGEALSLMDEDPTYGHFPLVYFHQGRVREGMGTAGFADSYREYLKIRGSSTEDPLVPEIRRRLSK
jgi:tetratricopeptide (TPR) repeat protein